jgi:penicillin-binding protein 2
MNFDKFKNNNTGDPFLIQEGRIKNGRVIRNYQADLVENALAGKAGSKSTIGRNFNFAKTKIIYFALMFFVGLLFARTAWLQIYKGDYYYDLAEGNRIREERVEAKRGIIYDQSLRPLVMNAANFMLYFIPSDLPEDEARKNEIITRVCQVVDGLSAEEVNAMLAEIEPGSFVSYQPLFIKDNIPYEQAMLLQIESSDMPGIVLSNRTRREYNLYSLSLSHILGYTGKISESELEDYGEEYLPIDYIGKTGIERFWENELRGTDGVKQIEVDAKGKEKKILNETLSADGHNLVLSLDIEAQQKLEEIIIDNLQQIGKSRVSAIVMNPNNGEIISMINFPSYNNNAFARGITQAEYSELINHPDNPLFNRSISGEYPSGSTIKPIIAVAALEEGIITEHTTFNSAGGLSISQWFFPDWKAGGHGITDVRKAIAESVNTFFYFIGGGYNDFEGLGVDKIVKYGSLFGLGKQTGVDLIGEADGFLPTEEWKESTKGEQWYIGDTYHLSIGQGDLLVTPLQVASFTSVFANGGELYRPHFIRQILDSDDHLLGYSDDAPIRENFISDKNIEIVRQGMRRTVTTGSAQSLQTVAVEVAGKTGTAQWSSQKDNHAWFTGFAPYDNPQIVLTILIEQGVEGSTNAVPIAKEVLNWWFSKNKYSKIYQKCL